MPTSPGPEITVDDVRNASKVLERALDRVQPGTVDSAVLDRVTAAKQEPDRLKRVTKISAALKQGAQDARAAQQAAQETHTALTKSAPASEFTTEALEELEALKLTLKKKIRQRAEEEMAKVYPVEPTGKKSRPPRRNRLSI